MGVAGGLGLASGIAAEGEPAAEFFGSARGAGVGGGLGLASGIAAEGEPAAAELFGSARGAGVGGGWGEFFGAVVDGVGVGAAFLGGAASAGGEWLASLAGGAKWAGAGSGDGAFLGENSHTPIARITTTIATIEGDSARRTLFPAGVTKMASPIPTSEDGEVVFLAGVAPADPLPGNGGAAMAISSNAIQSAGLAQRLPGSTSSTALSALVTPSGSFAVAMTLFQLFAPAGR